MALVDLPRQTGHGASRPDPYLVQSVVRCCQVLRAFSARERALPLHAIAQRTGLSKSLVFRLLHTLQDIGWIEKRDRAYHLRVQIARQKRKDSKAKSKRRMARAAGPGTEVNRAPGEARY